MRPIVPQIFTANNKGNNLIEIQWGLGEFIRYKLMNSISPIAIFESLRIYKVRKNNDKKRNSATSHRLFIELCFSTVHKAKAPKKKNSASCIDGIANVIWELIG